MLYRKVKKERKSKDFLLQGPKVDATNAEMDDWLAQFNSLVKDAVMKTLSEEPDPQASRIWLWGDYETSPGLPGMIPSIRLEPGGSFVR